MKKIFFISLITITSMHQPNMHAIDAITNTIKDPLVNIPFTAIASATFGYVGSRWYYSNKKDNHSEKNALELKNIIHRYKLEKDTSEKLNADAIIEIADSQFINNKISNYYEKLNESIQTLRSFNAHSFSNLSNDTQNECIENVNKMLDFLEQLQGKINSSPILCNQYNEELKKKQEEDHQQEIKRADLALKYSENNRLMAQTEYIKEKTAQLLVIYKQGEELLTQNETIKNSLSELTKLLTQMDSTLNSFNQSYEQNTQSMQKSLNEIYKNTKNIETNIDIFGQRFSIVLQSQKSIQDAFKFLNNRLENIGKEQQTIREHLINPPAINPDYKSE